MLTALRPGLRTLVKQNVCIYRVCFYNDWPAKSPSQNQRDSVRPRRRHHPLAASPEQIYQKLSANVSLPCGNDPDVFGDMSSVADTPPEFVEGDDADKAEGTEYSRELEEREWKKCDYAALIAELLAEKKFSMAMHVLETEMKKYNAKPDRYIFLQLITFCAKVGYPQKAFKLYNDMKKRSLPITSAVYTSLFNSCANCSKHRVGREYAERLRDIMIKKRFQPNSRIYHAMIKAFGRCGDYVTAFSLADEMMSKKILLEAETFNFLFQSCISQRRRGFRYALLVWHKMRQYNIQPDIYSYNLMLRCVRETGLGDFESTIEFFKKLTSDEKLLTHTDKTEPGVHLRGQEAAYPWDEVSSDVVCGNFETDTNQSTSLAASPAISPASIPNVRPNLLAPRPTLGGLVVVEAVTTAADRLMLLGGVNGYINSMKQDKIVPDIKTFTLLLDCIPSTMSAEKNLLHEMQLTGVMPDSGFFNALIYRRAKRFNYKEGFDVLHLMKKYGVEVDVATIHSLAICVDTKEIFQRFMEDVKEAGFSPTSSMLGFILKTALADTSFGFIRNVMDAYVKEEVPVHLSTLDQLAAFYKANVKALKGKMSDKKQRAFFQRDYFRTGMKLFRCKYSDWKTRIKVDRTFNADHTEQFRKTGTESEEVVPYLEKWKKGNRYTNASWRKKTATKSVNAST